MKKEAEAWIRIAAEELQSAEYLAEKKLYRMVCYHAQQSIEKNLKALLIAKDIDIPRTHNILDLRSAANEIGFKVPLSDDDAVFLNSIYRARYPADLGLIPSGEPTAADAEKAIKMALKLAKWMKND